MKYKTRGFFITHQYYLEQVYKKKREMAAQKKGFSKIRSSSLRDCTEINLQRSHTTNVLYIGFPTSGGQALKLLQRFQCGKELQIKIHMPHKTTLHFIYQMFISLQARKQKDGMYLKICCHFLLLDLLQFSSLLLSQSLFMPVLFFVVS